MNRKYFTVEQADNSLVLVKPIVKDIILKRKKMIAFKKAIKNAQTQENTDSVKKTIKTLVSSIKEISKSISYNLEELEMIGCYLKDFELGVIDFPSILKGRVVFLCWIFGEDKVANWHEIVHNFDKRQPVDAEFTTLRLSRATEHQNQ